MLHTWKPGLALGFRHPNLQRAQYRMEALVVPLNFCFLFQKEENNVRLSVLLSLGMWSLLLGSVLFIPFCWLTWLLWSLRNSYGKLTSSRTKTTYILGGMLLWLKRTELMYFGKWQPLCKDIETNLSASCILYRKSLHGLAEKSRAQITALRSTDRPGAETRSQVEYTQD